MTAGGKDAARQSVPGGLAGWLLARWRGRGRSEARLALVERITLAPRQTLCLVEVEGRRVLVATSPEGAAFYPLDARAERGDAHAKHVVRDRRRASW